MGPPGADGGDAEFSAERWGIIGRNTYGSPLVQFRTGPWGRTEPNGPTTVEPPNGVGSLAMFVEGRYDSSPVDLRDKVAFGNEVDFHGTPLADIDTLRYWIFTDMDPGDVGALPSIGIEVDPELDPAVNYSTLVYLPGPPTTLQDWEEREATAGTQPSGAGWYFTNGATATATGCTGGSPCTWAQVQAEVPDAIIKPSVQITKGRDNSFRGAVDALQVNDVIYDFEPLGVEVKPAP